LCLCLFIFRFGLFFVCCVVLLYCVLFGGGGAGGGKKISFKQLTANCYHRR